MGCIGELLYQRCSIPMANATFQRATNAAVPSAVADAVAVVAVGEETMIITDCLLRLEISCCWMLWLLLDAPLFCRGSSRRLCSFWHKDLQQPRYDLPQDCENSHASHQSSSLGCLDQQIQTSSKFGVGEFDNPKQTRYFDVDDATNEMIIRDNAYSTQE